MFSKKVMTKRPEPVFRTPMSFSPRIVGNKPVPSPSREELWKRELGFDDDQLGGSSSDSDSEEQSTKENKENISMVEYHTLQRQLEDRNKQRDELLFKVKTLSDKNRVYMQKLEKEETTKRQQMKILCKTQEIKLEEKDSLIENLQSIIEDHETKILQLEQSINGNTKVKPPGEYSCSPSSTQKLIEHVKTLQSEKASLMERVHTQQAEMESHTCGVGETDVSLQETIAKLEKENSQLREDLGKYSNGQLTEPAGPCHTDTEKQVEKLQSENQRLTSEITELNKSQAKTAKLFEQSNEQHKCLEAEIQRLKRKIENLQQELSHKRKTIEEKEAKHQDEVSKLMEESIKNSRRMRELMVEVTRLQAQEPEVVTKIKVVEVQVDSDKIKAELQSCQEERDNLCTKYDDAQTKCSNLSTELSQEQLKNEDLVNEIDGISNKLSEMAQVTVEKLQQAEDDKERAVTLAKRECQETIHSLQSKHESLCQSVAEMTPKYSQLIKSYKLLEKQVKGFPHHLYEVVSQVKQETSRAIHSISDHNKDLVRRYHREMYLRKKYHNELVELKGNIRVFCRVRPTIKEDGAGPMSQMVVDYDKDDDGLIYVNNKGRQQTFEADKVFTPQSSQGENRDASHYVVRYTCDDSIQLRQRSHIKYDGCVRVGETYPTQWGALCDIDDALVLHSGDYTTMRQFEQQEKSRIEADTSDVEWSPLRSPHQSPPVSPSDPDSPVQPAPKRPRLQTSKTTVVKNLATVIGRGSPAPSNSVADPPVPPIPAPASPAVPLLPPSVPAISTPTPASPLLRDVFTFTGSPEPHTTPTPSVLPSMHASTPITTPRSSTMVLSKFQSQMMRMMGEISRKQDVILRRLSTLENAHSTILSSVQRLQATQADRTPTIPTVAPDTDQTLDSIPEPHRIEMETLRGINSRSFGAGNFAKRLTVRLFPELFGVDDLRLQYSFYGGGCNRKKPLELQRREIIRTYVCHFYPECRPTDTWNAMVVTKINEGLRRPMEKKSRPRKRPSAAVIDIPVPPQCDDPIDTFVDNGLEYTRL